VRRQNRNRGKPDQGGGGPLARIDVEHPPNATRKRVDVERMGGYPKTARREEDREESKLGKVKIERGRGGFA